VQQALALWEERERGRIEILAPIQEAEYSLAAREGIIIAPESMRALAGAGTRRGRARREANGHRVEP